MSGGSVYKRRPEPVPARRFTPTAWGFGTGNQLVFVGTLAAFTASNPNIDAPLPPSSSNTPAQRRATREPAPRCFPEPAAILPTSIAILHRTRRHLPPHTGSSPNYPAPPTQISVSAVPARDAGGLRCRAAGWRACAPARPVYAGKSLPGRVGEAVNRRAPIRSGSGSAADLPATDGPRGPAAPEPTCDWWKRCWDGRRSGSSLARPGERSSASPTSTGGRRDFRSLRMLAASCYAETVDSGSAGHALQLLSQMTRREGQSDPADAGQRGERNSGGAPGRTARGVGRGSRAVHPRRSGAPAGVGSLRGAPPHNRKIVRFAHVVRWSLVGGYCGR
jgi:hypothetical protein